MVTLLFDLLKTARPRQWIKNLTLYAALIFTGHIYSTTTWWTDFYIVTQGVLVFTMVVAAVYFMNDLKDVESDKLHPFKKKRPIAAGRISKGMAILVAGSLLVGGMVWAFTLIPSTQKVLFGLVVGGYFLLQIAYTFWLKNVEVADVFVIATGFFVRVFAGAILINAHLSIWFLLCVMCTSLFLAVGKRRAELAILTEQASAHRKVMGKYTAQVLDAYVPMFATAAFFSWALYSFFFKFGDSNTTPAINLEIRTLTADKLLMSTIPVVIFGIMRYLLIIYDGSRAETPERVILSDKPLVLSVLVWGALVWMVLYVIPK